MCVCATVCVCQCGRVRACSHVSLTRVTSDTHVRVRAHGTRHTRHTLTQDTHSHTHSHKTHTVTQDTHSHTHSHKTHTHTSHTWHSRRADTKHTHWLTHTHTHTHLQHTTRTHGTHSSLTLIDTQAQWHPAHTHTPAATHGRTQRWHWSVQFIIFSHSGFAALPLCSSACLLHDAHTDQVSVTIYSMTSASPPPFPSKCVGCVCQYMARSSCTDAPQSVVISLGSQYLIGRC